MNFEQMLNFSSDGYDWDGNEFTNLFENEHTITLIDPNTMTVSGSVDDTAEIILESDEVLSFLMNFSLTSGLQLRVSNPGLGNVDVSASYQLEYEITNNGGIYSVDTYYLTHNFDQPPTITAGMLDYDSISLDLMFSPDVDAKLQNVKVRLADNSVLSISDLLLASDTAGSGYFELISVDRSGNITVSDKLISDEPDQYELDGLLPGDGLATLGDSISPYQDWADDERDVLYDVSYSNTQMMAQFWGLISGVLDFTNGDQAADFGAGLETSYTGWAAAEFLPEITSQIDLTQKFIFDPEDVHYTASIDGVVVGSGKLGEDFEFSIPESFDGFEYEIDWEFKLQSNMQAFGSASHVGDISIYGVGADVGVRDTDTGALETSSGYSFTTTATNGSDFTIDNLYNSGIVDVSDAFTLNMTTYLQVRTYDFTIEATSLEDLIAQETLVPKTSSDLIDEWLQAGLGQLEGVQISDVQYIGADQAVFQVDTFAAYNKFNDQNGLLFSTGGLPDNQNDQSDASINNYTIGHEAIRELMEKAMGAGFQSFDASGMEFSLFVSDEDIKSIRFEFVFGSEEFPEFVDTPFSDFAAIVVNGENVALFDDDPTKPMGAFTEAIQSGYYIDNNNANESDTAVAQWTIEWDGFTEYLSVTAPLNWGQENTIEIIIADTYDWEYDSGLYIGDIELITDDGIATSILKIGDFEYGDDIYATIAKEELNLPEGSNMIVGTLENLDGDMVTGFETGDSVLVLGETLTMDQITVSNDGTRLEIDADQDGNADSILNFRGDFVSASFVTSQHNDGTLITAFFESKDITGNSDDGINSGGSGADDIFDALGNDQLNGKGGDDKMVSLSGTNDFSGGDGSDFIVGGMHGDVMFGDAGNDILRGDASLYLGGSDHLNGGRGDDILMGGQGADIFEFNPNAGSDIIGGFDIDAVTKSDLGHNVAELRADFEVIFDLVQLTGFDTVNSGNVMDFVADGDNGAVLMVEGTTITFYGIDKSDLSADHFEFI